MRVSNQTLTERNRRQAVQIERLTDERDAFQKDASACGYALAHCAAELDRMKETVAMAIVAAGHSSTVVHDVRSFAESLREALAASGVDLRIELARLEGADL